MRLEQQMNFIRELDKLKTVLRQTFIVDKSRRENTGEHSWHVTIAALTLAEYADEPIDVARVLKMLLVHDIIEIDAGDTFAFDTLGYQDKSEREKQAAERLFGLLPAEQGNEFKALWQEFEDITTADSRYANAIDRIMPFLHNIWTEGDNSWKEHRPTYEQIFKRNQQGAGASSTILWEYIQQLLNHALENDWISGGEAH